MALSISEQRLLEDEFDKLQLLTRFPNRFMNNKTSLISFCTEHNIPLYNLPHMRISTSRRLLDRLIAMVTGRSKELSGHWQQDFELGLREANEQLLQEHDRAFLSIADQVTKRGFYAADTLLTMPDMEVLLADQQFHSSKVLLAPPFSLTQRTQSQDEYLHTLLGQAQDERSKTVFLPVLHDGHWFYLLKEEDKWSVEDSQPLPEKGLSPRQVSMMEASVSLLNVFDAPGQEASLNFRTTGKQINDFDCGTQVVNAYRSLVREDFMEKSHAGMMQEALAKQTPEPETEYQAETEHQSAAIDMDICKPAPLASKDAVESYKQSILAQWHGLFASITNKIDINGIDDAEALHGESDEGFAVRLQEAEFRKAGLM